MGQRIRLGDQHSLHRYWNIRPQQTLQVPGPWLRKGGNDVIILDLPGPETPGNPWSAEGWTIADVDSEEPGREDGMAENAIDGQTANFWHTQWSAAQTDHPHHIALDLGNAVTIGGFRYIPRHQGPANADGRIKDYRISIGGSQGAGAEPMASGGR